MSLPLVLALLVPLILARPGPGAADGAVAREASDPTWIRLIRADTLPGRSDAVMATNPAGGVVLFGGSVHPSTGLLALGDTWTFDGERWTQQHPPYGPPPRAQAAMAYDAARGVAVLFGGNTFTRRLGDTWTWDGRDWTLHQAFVAPSARSQAAIAYDAARDMVLLFGGTGDAGGTADTWAWDGATWTLLQPTTSPPPRVGAVMAYDAANERVVLYGGCLPGPQTCLPAYDTWTWDGTTWMSQTPTVAPSISGGSLAYHAALGAVVLFGSVSENRAWQTQTWTWNGSTWTRLAPTASPSPRWRPPMAYDPQMGAIILFGGEDVTSANEASLGDTWAFASPR